MTTLTQYFKSDTKDEIFSGVVTQKTATDKYEVSTGGKTVSCQSIEDLSIGSQVLYTRSESVYVILRKSGQRSTSTVQVIVDG